MKNKSMLALLLASLLLLSMQPVFAASSMQPAEVRNPVTDECMNTIEIPETANIESPAIVPLGTALDNGKLVEGYAIVDYTPGYGRGGPPSGKGPKGGKGEESSYYEFLAKGARWKSTEQYVLGPPNQDDLTSNFVEDVIAASMMTWDTEVAFEIFGSQGDGPVDGVDVEQPDNKNEILFGNISQQGAIAVAVVWGIFHGPPNQRQLVEYDIVFDDVDFNYGYAGPTSETELGDTTAMDLQNIATHELGHAAGLADLYQDSCSEQTMYGYASNGETKKRTLNTGDIAGVKELYK